MALAAVALGSNLPSEVGDSAQTLRSATRSIRSLGDVVAVSSFIVTDPVGYLDQPPFLNGAVLLQTALGPLDLLRALLQIERSHGRDRAAGIAKGPRTLDLDLLLYGEDVLATAELTLPHPEMHRRRFVLEPLAEIAPEMWHPTERATVAQLLRTLDEPTRVY